MPDDPNRKPPPLDYFVPRAGEDRATLWDAFCLVVAIVMGIVGAVMVLGAVRSL